MKLIEKETKSETKNCLAEFPPNTLGVIRAWGTHTRYVGNLVVLKKDPDTTSGFRLWTLKGLIENKPGNSWGNWDDLLCRKGHRFIEPLISGEIIIDLDQ